MLDREIENALRNDPGVTPSPDFTGRVMVCVRHAAGEREALAFPWRRLTTGLSVCAAVTVAGLLAAPRPDLQAVSRAAAEYGLVFTAPWLAAALVLAFLPTWWSFRLIGQRG